MSHKSQVECDYCPKTAPSLEEGWSEVTWKTKRGKECLKHSCPDEACLGEANYEATRMQGQGCEDVNVRTVSAVKKPAGKDGLTLDQDDDWKTAGKKLWNWLGTLDANGDPR